MANSYCWFAGEKTNSHQSQTDPRQPVLACLAVGVKECSDALEYRHNGILYVTYTSAYILVMNVYKVSTEPHDLELFCGHLWGCSESIGTAFIGIIHELLQALQVLKQMSKAELN